MFGPPIDLRTSKNKGVRMGKKNPVGVGGSDFRLHSLRRSIGGEEGFCIFRFDAVV